MKKKLEEADAALEEAFEQAKKEKNSAEILRFVKYFEARQDRAKKELRLQEGLAPRADRRTYSLEASHVAAQGPWGDKPTPPESLPPL